MIAGTSAISAFNNESTKPAACVAFCCSTTRSRIVKPVTVATASRTPTTTPRTT